MRHGGEVRGFVLGCLDEGYGERDREITCGLVCRCTEGFIWRRMLTK